MLDTRILRPQPGPQSAFLASPADVVIYGGAAGGGKTMGLLLDPLRYVDLAGYGAVIFRRQYPDITAEGGMWDESFNIYPHAGAASRENPLEWRFKSGATVSFRHMQHDKDRFSYKGAQIPAILWDQLEEFSAKQFWYLFSRNRSTCGVDPYIRATVNPPEEDDHWLFEIIGAWVLPTDPAFPFPPGELRYFTRDGDDIVWVGEDWRDPDGQPATSITFIPATVYDNPILLESNPAYLARLRSMPMVDRERLLNANWTIRASGGMFKREWFKIVAEAPADLDSVARSWDEAGTEDDGDWTVGAKVGLKDGVWYILDVVRERVSPAGVDALIDQAAAMDGWPVDVILQQEPGSSGKARVEGHKRRLAGRTVRSAPPTGDKATRAKPLASAAEAGNVALVAEAWNAALINEAIGFPGRGHDDQIDAISWAMLMMTGAERGGAAPVPAGAGLLGSRSRPDAGPKRYSQTAGAGARYGGASGAQPRMGTGIGSAKGRGR